MKPLSLQEAIIICEKIESGEVEPIKSPHTDPETNYMISRLEDSFWAEWGSCTKNNQPDWLAFRPEDNPFGELYLKSKKTGHVYYLSL